MNKRSNRSHTIFRITCESRLRREIAERTMDPCGILISQLSFVDLAGSENVKYSGAEGDRLEEAKKINMSLSVLSRVIYSLANKTSESEHIAYRDSKLTRILQSSLDGNSRIAIIACITPSSSFIVCEVFFVNLFYFVIIVREILSERSSLPSKRNVFKHLQVQMRYWMTGRSFENYSKRMSFLNNKFM